MKRIVIRVAIKGQKSRSKAMRIVGGVAGVESVAFAAHDSNHMVVTGEGIDAVKLTKLLRRKVGSSEIVSVGPGELGGDGYGYGYGIPVGGYYSYPYAYGSGQGYGYESRNQNPYSNGPSYGYETINQNPNSCSIM
ncbi:disease resistance protein Pik-1-like [Rhododendron vialii]|uniref:disease resistance protein Pik-1-like n=1 Tax=Rhododendron vialii TaxID=182163 RepID=UPI00265E921E|nr:disease resistance protein Pik-1-like [Rhododendron vialii]